MRVEVLGNTPGVRLKLVSGGQFLRRLRHRKSTGYDAQVGFSFLYASRCLLVIAHRYREPDQYLNFVATHRIICLSLIFLFIYLF